jgi:hypothetical protein
MVVLNSDCGAGAIDQALRLQEHDWRLYNAKTQRPGYSLGDTRAARLCSTVSGVSRPFIVMLLVNLLRITFDPLIR